MSLEDYYVFLSKSTSAKLVFSYFYMLLLEIINLLSAVPFIVSKSSADKHLMFKYMFKHGPL